MKGRILGFSSEEGTGVISAEDGKRYTFAASEWKSGQAVRSGIQVDFEPDGGTAGGIYPDSNASIDLSALKESANAAKAKQVLTSSLAVPLTIILLLACAMPALTLPSKGFSLFDLPGILNMLSFGAAITGAEGPSAGFKALLMLRFLAPLMAIFLFWRAWASAASKMVVLATGAAAILAFLLIELVKIGLTQGSDLGQMIGLAVGTGIGAWLILLCGIGLILTGLGILGNPLARIK
ncbi:hypothetical protein GRI58_14250 [Porphyrobacter algicida]|uniref:DUF805 domain-containing protein n=1 Tax=Qipengyuania algicida TaxID=1836209 RepID=A0A845ASW7_9SPHN|nr:hypothetical protein [Qipengyuania algicida]MXP29968.1 hypothetical protein [Qipengyuania algicida]